MFRIVSLSSFRSLALYTQQQLYVGHSGYADNLLAGSGWNCRQIPRYPCTGTGNNGSQCYFKMGTSRYPSQDNTRTYYSQHRHMDIILFHRQLAHIDNSYRSDVWLTVNRNYAWIRKTNQMSLFVFCISLLIVAQHVSGSHVPIIRSLRLRDVIALCWYVPWLQEGGQVRLAGSASMDALPTNRS